MKFHPQALKMHAERYFKTQGASANERLFYFSEPFGAAKCAAHIGMSGERYLKNMP